MRSRLGQGLFLIVFGLHFDRVRVEGSFLTVFGLHFDRVRLEGFFLTLCVHLKLGGAVFGLILTGSGWKASFSTLYVHLKLGGAVFGLHFDQVRVEAHTSPSFWYMFVSPGAREPNTSLGVHACNQACMLIF